MTVAIINEDDILKRIGACIKECRGQQDNMLSLIVTDSFYGKLNEILSSSKIVNSITSNGVKVYLIEEMRLNIIKIDHYV